jgi:rhamnosyltransferase
MITQDAVPMNRFWLKELCRPFESIPNLAASYSRQIPQPDCNPLEAKDIYIGAPCVDEVRYADFGVDWQRDDYHGNIHRYIRFSNVSACYDGELLRANPFDEQLRMVEDQEWSRRMIEKGYATYYASKSVVVHSHNFSIGQVYRRHFDYGMSFRHFLPGSPPKRTSFLRATVFDYMNDVPYILNDNRRLWSKLKWICRSPFFRFAAHYGLYKGWRCA